jgi:nitroimidazol reductase NimA-like FMN-containing flavoprotein (pyridoxamine 5'-phosphate oxidase superfamily)
MFPEMLRKDKEVRDGLMDIFGQADWCTFGANSPQGYPYLFAVNQVVVGDKLYFHCAQKGFKLDCIAHDPRVCVKAVAREAVVSEDYTTDYLSVVAFGQARLVEDLDLRRDILTKLMERFSPNHPKTESLVSGGVESTAVVEITIEHMTGKEN